MKTSDPSPPPLFLRFFKWFCHPDLVQYIEGDLMELYAERLNVKGKWIADWRFVIDVLLLLRPSIIRPAEGHTHLNRYGMYKSYFKISWRNLQHNKGYSLINIGGLALGMGVAMVLGLWVYDELTFNKSFENYDRVARVYRNNTWDGIIETSTPQVPGLGTLLRNEYGAHLEHVAMVRWLAEDRVISLGDSRFTQKGYFVQPEAAEIFSLQMIRGSRQGLQDLKSIFLSESLANKLFPDTDPLNQVLSMDAKWDLKVAGVYRDITKNCDFNDASFFAPLDLYIEGWSSLNVWDNYFLEIYVQLKPDADFDNVSGMIKHVMLPRVDPKTANSRPEIFLLPMRQWHLESEFENGIQVTSQRMLSVWYFGTIGGFVLLLACINFMNLSTARSEKRAKEVGIRKSIGSVRGQLIQQFYSESLMVAVIAFLVSIIMVRVTLPAFNAIADKNISIPWTEPLFWLMCLAFTLSTGLLAGSYPALYLSSFKPVSVLKGSFKVGRLASMPRRVLVIVQFTVSISLIIGTGIVHRQLEYGKNRPVGYSRSGLLSLQPRSPEYYGKYDALRNELKNTGMVDEIAEANYPVTSTLGWNGGFTWEGNKVNDLHFNTISVTYEYGRTVGWEFVVGRDFSREYSSDLSGVIINESALKLMDLKNPIGEQLVRTRENGESQTYTILGVVKDMVKGSPFDPTDPSIIFLSEKDLRWLYLRMNPEASAHEALPAIQHVFSQLIPSAPFDYTFADEDYLAKFKGEERIGILATIFSVLAILISCLGLFGLASFVAEQRTKEIGIRKVLGATVGDVWKMLSKEFVVLIVIAATIAVPLSLSFMTNWLQHYEYRTSMPWYLFVASGLGALVLTLITISYQAIKAAVANPVTSLRSE